MNHKKQLTHTIHSLSRATQRGCKLEALNLIHNFGETTYVKGGAKSFYIKSKNLPFLKNEMSKTDFKKYEKSLKKAMVVKTTSKTDLILTVIHPSRRLWK
tara:strand:- start:145 stop:444 length:300 start_codon:yes stop_codon:yes gene_type:complete